MIDNNEKVVKKFVDSLTVGQRERVFAILTAEQRAAVNAVSNGTAAPGMVEKFAKSLTSEQLQKAAVLLTTAQLVGLMPLMDLVKK